MPLVVVVEFPLFVCSQALFAGSVVLLCTHTIFGFTRRASVQLHHHAPYICGQTTVEVLGSAHEFEARLVHSHAFRD